MIADDDPHVLDFYDQVLGLQRWMDEHTPYDNATGSRTIFGLEPGEGFHMVDFDDPRSGKALAERRSGKLKCVRFAANAQNREPPGALARRLPRLQPLRLALPRRRGDAAARRRRRCASGQRGRRGRVRAARLQLRRARRLPVDPDRSLKADDARSNRHAGRRGPALPRDRAPLLLALMRAAPARATRRRQRLPPRCAARRRSLRPEAAHPC